MTDKLRIMVLDDEPIVCKRLKPALEKLGYEVDTFTQSPEAMLQIQQSSYDIIITDLKMKEIDGMRFLERSQETPSPNGGHRHHRLRHHGDRQAIVPQGGVRFHRQALQIDRDSRGGESGRRQAPGRHDLKQAGCALRTS